MTTRRQFLTSSAAVAVIPINGIAIKEDLFQEVRTGRTLQATKVLNRDLDLPDIELRVYRIDKWDRRKIWNRGNYELYSLTDGVVRRCKLTKGLPESVYALEVEIPGRQYLIYPNEFGVYVHKPSKWT